MIGSPAFGFIKTGTEENSSNSFTMEESCLGPREQFTPSATTPRASNVITMDFTVAPKKVFPFSSKLIVATMGSFEFSFAAIMAAFNS